MMQSSLYASIEIIMACYALGLAFTIVARNLLLKRGILDRPNTRSSHKVAVPRGAGWAVIAVLIPGMAIIGLYQDSLSSHINLIWGILLLAAISWIDDSEGAHPGLRLAAHLVAAYLGSLAFGTDQTLFGNLLPFWCDRLVMIVGWAWFINLFNFMDGIDGITGVESIAIATGVCMVLAAANVAAPFADNLTLVFTGTCLGFLVLNWHPAKIFLGDIGSVPLGYIAGFLLLTLALNHQWAPALILPLYYLADSGITLSKRAFRGEKVWKAHREHFYQTAALGVGRHDHVVIWILLANVGLMADALMAVKCPLTGILAGVAIVALLLWKMHKSAPTSAPKGRASKAGKKA
jgi:UDP-N-acetylmuramyl pentapeptide phosphotransferase/UDP-N-acetylglucosamine-1-phosphate transferase